MGMSSDFDTASNVVKQVSSVSLLSMNQDVSFSKDVKSVAEKYQVV